MQEIKIGNTSVTIDWSYAESRTEEQTRIDDEMFIDAFWALVDEMERAS